MSVRARSIEKVVVHAVDASGVRPRSDRLIAEEPLEIRVEQHGTSQVAAVTMRTPGADFELAAGFLYSEGVIRDGSDVTKIDYCSDVDVEQLYNVVTVHVTADSLPDLEPLNRHFQMTSACGVCGKTTIDAIEARGVGPVEADLSLDDKLILQLPERLRESQKMFDATGGVHAAGLFSRGGDPIAVREDVGRHNAVDKLVGWALKDRRLPLDDAILVVSGRAGFEIVQKAAVARIPIVCAVSAPTSLAVDVAQRFDMTLVGFLRADRFNVYSGRERIVVREG